MPKKRKVLQYADLLSPMSLENLNLLKKEVGLEIRFREKKLSNIKDMEKASKIRDKIRIGQTVSFSQQGVAGGVISGKVVGIFSEKLQVEINERKRSISITRIKSFD